jgi:glutathione S-transferase
MKLLYTDNSPYARKVRIVAAEKHIELALEKVVLADPDCIVKNHNPLGKVPVLILPNGESLYDSTVIVEYLDKKSPVANLIPIDQELRVAVKRLESLADGICDAAVAVMLEKRRDVAKQDETVIAKQIEKVMRGLTVLEADYADKTWSVNNKYSLADIAIGCMLGYVGLRFEGQIDLTTGYPNLARLHDAMLVRPVFANTKPLPKV